MQKYIAVMKTGFQDALQYRLEFVLGNLGWGIRLLISVLLWSAVMKTSGGTVGAYTLNDMIVYFVMVQIITAFTFSRASFIIVADIRSGDLNNYLVKPISYMFYTFFGEISRNLIRLVFGTIIFGGLLFFLNRDFVELLSPLKLLLWIPSLFFAHAISFLIVSLIALTGFWVINANRFTFIYFGILHILSGLLIPLDLFPKAIEKILLLTPFPYIFYFPAKFLLTPGFTAFHFRGLLMQIFFIALFSLFVTLLFRRGIKQYEAVGR